MVWCGSDIIISKSADSPTLKVLVVSLGQTFPVPPPGYGGEATILTLLKGLRDAGVEADLAAPAGSVNPAGKVIDTGPPTGAWDGNEAAYKVYRPLMDEYDVVHSHQHDGWPYRAKVEGSTVALVHTLQGLTTWQKPPPLPKPCFVTLTEWHRAHTKARLGVDSAVVHNPIDLAAIPIETEKDDYYLCLGLVAPHKGHLQAIAAAEKTGVKLVLAGETRFVPSPEHVQRVRDAAAAAGFPLYESPNAEAKNRLVAKARGLILPFQVPESGSLLLLEAMAAGTDVFSTRPGGVAELPCRPLEALRHGPRDPEKVRSLVAAYDAPVIAAKYRDLYRKAVEGGW